MVTDIEKQKLELSLKIDELIKELKNKFLKSASPVASGPDGKVGVWDRVKNWWNKFRYGKFGNLAQVEQDPEAKKDSDEPKSECYQFSFQEYRAIKDSCDILETIIEKNQDSLNEEESENLKNLRLFRIIDDWGKKFKQVILDLVYPDKPTNPVVDPVAGGEGVRGSNPTVGLSDPKEKEKAAPRAAEVVTKEKKQRKPRAKKSKVDTTEPVTTTPEPAADMDSDQDINFDGW